VAHNRSTRCIALSEGDRGGSLVVRDKPFPNRSRSEIKNHIHLTRREGADVSSKS